MRGSSSRVVRLMALEGHRQRSVRWPPKAIVPSDTMKNRVNPTNRLSPHPPILRHHSWRYSFILIAVIGSAWLSPARLSQAWYPYGERYQQWQAKRPMMMGGAHSCLPRDNLVERMARFKAAGLNTLVSTEYHAVHFYRAAQKVGVEWATTHPERFASPEWRVINPSLPYDGGTAREAFKHIFQTPGCAFAIAGEGPKEERHLHDMAAFSDWVRQHRPDLLTFACLSIDKIDHDQYVKNVRPDVFNYYHYPLADEGHELRGYLPDLKKARATCMKHQLPFWMYVQAWGAKRSSPEESKRIPDEADLRYLMFTMLAHGGNGAIMFLYYGGAGGNHQDRSVIYDTVVDHERAPPHLHRLENSVATRAWYAIRDVTPEVQTLARALLNLRTKDPIGYRGDFPARDWCKSFDGHGPLRNVVNRDNEKEPAMVAFFDDRHGQEYFMVVNMVHGENMSKLDGLRTLRLTLHPNVTEIERLNRLTGRVETLQTREGAPGERYLDVQLEGGTGDLFKWSGGRGWDLREMSDRFAKS